MRLHQNFRTKIDAIASPMVTRLTTDQISRVAWTRSIGIVDGGCYAEDPNPAVSFYPPCVNGEIGERGTADPAQQDVISVRIGGYQRPQ